MTTPFRRPVMALATLGALVLFNAPVAGAQSAQGAMQRVQQAVQVLQDGRAETALEELETIVEESPELVEAHYYAGLAAGQLGRDRQALDHLLRATELRPGLGEAHYRACLLAHALGDYELSWEQAIRAQHAGFDMQQAFAELRQVHPEPADFQERIGAPRIFVGGIDTEAVAERDNRRFTGSAADPGSAGADTRGGGAADPFASAGARGGPPAGGGRNVALDSGASVAGQLQGEFFEVHRQFGLSLARSTAFGVAPRPEIADYILTIKVDEATEGGMLIGFVKLLDYDADAEVYSRPLELRNIASSSDLRNDIDRTIGYLEEWLRQGGSEEKNLP